MFLSEFKKLTSHYQEGAMKISFRSAEPVIITENLQLKMEYTKGNYDLYFNEEGRLTVSVHFDEYKNVRIMYGYDKHKRLSSAIEVTPVENVFKELSEFTYDDQGRLASETCRTNRRNDQQMHVAWYVYSYSGNKEKISAYSTDQDENVVEYSFHNVYDKGNRLIQSKGIVGKRKFVSFHKYEYDSEGNLIRQDSLNSKSKIISTFQYHPPFTAFTKSSLTFISKNQNYQEDNIYTYNERNHWIHMATLLNGNPSTFCTREILYY